MSESSQNIVLVVVDCLRQDFTTEDYSDTPFIDSLREDGLSYTNMFSTASTTTPCIGSLFTGLYSEKNDVVSLSKADLNKDVKTLAGRMKENGYSTYAYATGPIVEDTGLDRGFDYFECRDKDDNLVGEWGESFMEKVENFEEPFFLYLHLWELHRMIDVPEEFEKPEYGDRPYDRVFSALDRSLEDLYDKLPDDTVFVVHGDHGESITWRDNKLHRGLKWARTFWRYMMSVDTRKVERMINRVFARKKGPKDHFMEDTHGETVFDFTTNVPFIIHGKDIETGTVENQVRQVDVYPTLLDIAGIEYDERLDGLSLLPIDEVKDRDAYIRAVGPFKGGERNWIEAIRSDGYKLLTWPNHRWSPELYNLEKDPLEMTVEMKPEKIRELKDRFPDDELKEMEELEIEERLKDLGYM